MHGLDNDAGGDAVRDTAVRALTASTRLTSEQSPCTWSTRQRWLPPARNTSAAAAALCPASPFSPPGQDRPVVRTWVVFLAFTRSAHCDRLALNCMPCRTKVRLVAHSGLLPP